MLLVFFVGSEFRKAMGHAAKPRLGSVKAQDLFTPDGSLPASPSTPSTFDYSGSQSTKSTHSSSSKNRHRSKSHSDDYIRKQVVIIALRCLVLPCFDLT